MGRELSFIQLAVFGLAMAFVVACGGGYLLAQATATGTIQGTVTDVSGAIVVGAQVQAVQKSTGSIRTTTTNDFGNFRFELLSASLYEIKTTKPGFGTVVQKIERSEERRVGKEGSIRW